MIFFGVFLGVFWCADSIGMYGASSYYILQVYIFSQFGDDSIFLSRSTQILNKSVQSSACSVVSG